MSGAGYSNLRLIEGGSPERGRTPRRGERVLVEDGAAGARRIPLRPATVVFSEFKTFVFRGEVSVRFEDGSLGLVELEKVHRASQSPPEGP